MQPISAIIPTYNGEMKIQRLLQSLKSQTFKDFEVVVIIDGSTDKTLQILNAFEAPFQLKIINQKNSGRASVRNNGAKHATGKILVFYDDDMVPAANSIERHSNFHNHYEGILSGKAYNTLGRDKTDIQNYKANLSAKWLQDYSSGLNELNEKNLLFAAANCSIKKSDFETLEGFNSNLTDAEDYDLGQRALQKGIKVYFDKDNIAEHSEEITCKSFINRQREYNNQRKNLNYDSTRKSTSIKHILYYPFSLAFWPWLIDHFNIFRVLPKRLRYFLYGKIIHALSKEYPTVALLR